jgi:large subunit ribosomal protein L4
MDLPVIDDKGQPKTTLAASDDLFGRAYNEAVVHQVLTAYLANARTGTRKQKARGEVNKSNQTPWRQKGTGRARQGSIRSPQWSGGGVVFGPVPRSYDHKLTKKTRRAALRSALSLRAKEGALAVVEGLALDEFKTKRVVELLDGLGLAGQSVLIVIAGAQPQLEVSARNLPGVAVLRAAGLNVYDVLRHARLVIARDALDAIGARLGGTAGDAA